MNAHQRHGVPGPDLSDEDLLRELEQLHQTRTNTLRHGSDDALENSTQRTAELEQEYVHRFPNREVDPDRLRSGARERSGQDA